MANYQLTNKAENEIDNIYEYSILNFGKQIAQNYIFGLHNCFGLLAEHQNLGNNYSFIKSGLLRYEYRSHSIYYQRAKQGILIIRVLGKQQNPILHIGSIS